jgi:hypothetical protein
VDVSNRLSPRFYPIYELDWPWRRNGWSRWLRWLWRRVRGRIRLLHARRTAERRAAASRSKEAMNTLKLPPQLRSKCGPSPPARQDSSKLRADDPQPSAYGFFGEDAGESNSVGELRVDTRGVTTISNPSEREDGKRVGNSVRPMWVAGRPISVASRSGRSPASPSVALLPTWSQQLQPKFIGGRRFHPKGRPELREGSLSRKGAAPNLCRVTRQGGRSGKTTRRLCATSCPTNPRTRYRRSPKPGPSAACRCRTCAAD